MTDEAILKLALEKGKLLILEAKGPPAKIVACGIAAAMVVAAGTYVYGRRAVNTVRSGISKSE